jgi:hypothetical protein
MFTTQKNTWMRIRNKEIKDEKPDCCIIIIRPCIQIAKIYKIQIFYDVIRRKKDKKSCISYILFSKIGLNI